MSILSMLGLGNPKPISNDPVVAQIRASEYRELIDMISNVKEAAKAIDDLKNEVEDLRTDNARLKDKIEDLIVENDDLKRQLMRFAFQMV